jgi:hypothetical protein
MADEIIELLKLNIDVQAAVTDAKKLKEEIARLKEETGKAKTAEDKMSESYIINTQRIKAYSKELLAKENLIKSTIIATNAQLGSLTQLRAEHEVAAVKLNAMSAAERENTETGKALTAEKLRLKEAITELEKATGTYTGQTANYEIVSKSLKQELKEVVIQMQKLAVEGKDGGSEFQELAKKAGQFKDAMNATNDQIKTFAVGNPMEQNLKIAKGAFDATSGAAQGYEGAMALVGSENEAATEAIKKMVALQSIQNGVTQVYEALQKESAFMLGVTSLKTNIQSAAQYVYTTAIGTSTGALKLFRLALLGTGIGAIIVAIGLLVENWEKLTGSIDNSIESLTKLNSYQRFKLERQQEIIGLIKQESELNQANIKNEIDLAKAKGASQLEMIEMSEKLSKAKLDESNASAEVIKKDIANIETLKKQQKELSNEVAKATLDKVEGDKQSEDKLKALQDQYSVLNDRIKQVNETQKNQANAQNEILISRIEKQKIINENELRDSKSVIDAKLLNAKLGSEEELTLKKQQLEAQKKIDLTDLNLTNDDKKLINAKYKEDELRLDAEYAVNKMNAEIEAFKISNQSKLDEAQENGRFLTQVDIDEEKSRIENIVQLEKEGLDLKLENNLISQTDYNNQILQLDTDLNQQQVDLQKQFEDTERQRKLDVAQTDYDNELTILEDTIFQKIDLQKKGLDVQEQQELASAEKTGANKELIIKKYAKAERDIEKLKQDSKLKLTSDFAGNIATIFGEQSKVGKAAAVAAATINTYQAATGAYASLAPIPIVGPVLGAAAAVAAAVAGFQNVKKILSVNTDPKSGDGGGGGSVDMASTSMSNISSSNNSEVLRASANAEIGQGIIGRNTSSGDQTGNQVQTAVIIDEVTARQTEQSNINKTRNL